MAYSLQLEIRGAQQVIENLGKSSMAVRFAMAKVGALLERAVKLKLSGQVLKVRTGRLRSSITHEVRDVGGTVELVVGTNVAYARIHEFGGVIIPKRAKYLTFVVGGKRVFAKRVVIPRRPYFEPALDESGSKIVETFGMELEKRLSGGAA